MTLRFPKISIGILTEPFQKMRNFKFFWTSSIPNFRTDRVFDFVWIRLSIEVIFHNITKFKFSGGNKVAYFTTMIFFLNNQLHVFLSF